MRGGDDLLDHSPVTLADAAGVISERALEIAEACADAYSLIDALSWRVAGVMYMRYWLNATLDDCARTLGVSRERIRQMETTALRKLRMRACAGYVRRRGAGR